MRSPRSLSFFGGSHSPTRQQTLLRDAEGGRAVGRSATSAGAAAAAGHTCFTGGDNMDPRKMRCQKTANKHKNNPSSPKSKHTHTQTQKKKCLPPFAPPPSSPKCNPWLDSPARGPNVFFGCCSAGGLPPSQHRSAHVPQLCEGMGFALGDFAFNIYYVQKFLPMI